MGNCVLILQSFTNSRKLLVGLCSEKSAKLSGDMHEGFRIKFDATNMDIKEEEMSVIKVEEDSFLDVKEEETSVVKFEEEMLVDTKEDFCSYVNSPTIKAEQDQVSYICICPLFNTFYEYPILCTVIYCVDLCLSSPVNK